MGNSIIGLGILLVIIGLVTNVFGKVGIPRLPGDIFIQNEHSTFYFPIVSSIVISVVLTIILNIFNR